MLARVLYLSLDHADMSHAFSASECSLFAIIVISLLAKFPAISIPIRLFATERLRGRPVPSPVMGILGYLRSTLWASVVSPPEIDMRVRRNYPRYCWLRPRVIWI